MVLYDGKAIAFGTTQEVFARVAGAKLQAPAAQQAVAGPNPNNNNGNNNSNNSRPPNTNRPPRRAAIAEKV
jgi:hypothetical protein